MPNYWPLSSGNWSSLSNWVTANSAPFNAATLPTTADDVFANNRIVYIDGNYQVNSIRNISATNITQGGYFVLNNGFTLSAFVYGGGVTDVACLQFLSAAPASGTLVGNLCAGDPSATVLRPKAFENVSSGNFTIIGNSLGGFNNNSNADFTNAANGIVQNTGSGNLTLIGSFSGDVRSPTADRRLIAIRNQGTGNLTLLGSVSGGTGTSSFGIYNNSTGNIFISGGGAFGGSGPTSYGIYNNSTGTITVNGIIMGGNGRTSSGLWNNSTGSIFVTGFVIGGGVGETGGSNTSSVGIYLAAAANVNVFGEVRGTGTPALNQHGIQNIGSGTSNISISGLVTGGGNESHGIYNATNTSNISITGICRGGPAVGSGGSGIQIFSGVSNINVIGQISSLGGNYGINIENTSNARLIGDIPLVGYGIRTAGSGGTITVIGNVFGGTASNVPGIQLVAGASCNIIGNVFGGTGNSSGVQHSSTNTVSITGNVTGGSGGVGISNTGPLFILGNVTGGSGANGITNSTGVVVVSGNVTGGTGSGINGIRNIGGNSVRVSGTATGGIGGSAIANVGSNARVEVKRSISNDFGIGSTGITVAAYGVEGAVSNTTVVEEIQSGSRGLFPTNGNVFINRTTNTLAAYRTNTGQVVTMFTSLSGTNLNPIPRNVRQGVTYDFGALVGTLAMPIPAVVNAGVPVDNTVGTGVFTPIGVWSFPVSAITSATSMGGRVKNSATIDSIGALIRNLT